METEPYTTLGTMNYWDMGVLVIMILLALFFAALAIVPSFMELWENRKAKHADRDEARKRL